MGFGLKKAKVKSTTLAKGGLISKTEPYNSAISVYQKEFFISLKKVSEITRLPEEGECMNIITEASINAIDFFNAIIAEEGEAKHVYISVYRIGRKATERLIELLKNETIKNLHMIINDGFRKLIPDVYNLIYNAEKELKNFNFKEVNTHTKIFLIETKKNRYILQGSGNCSTNARQEQYTLSNNRDIYENYKNYFDKMLSGENSFK